MRRDLVNIVEEKLGIKLGDKLFERGRLVIFDKRLKINRFIWGGADIERVELEWRPPVIFVVAKICLGRYRTKIPLLMFDIAPD
ncbi:MAG: hypothetical protein DRJ18_03065 [Candidatus Methanomethylicota archaeon]|nr:MAG: hypothetical protein DRJ18_03065 [Candidatus Verstraetearchaeota archaeon]